MMRKNIVGDPLYVYIIYKYIYIEHIKFQKFYNTLKIFVENQYF